MGVSRRRPTIAFLSDYYLGDYQTTLHNAVESAACQYDMNLLCIIGRGVDAPLAYERVQNKIYADLSTDNISGIIFVGTSLSNHCGKERILSFCRGFEPIPMCNIGLALEGIPSILANNEEFSATIRHLAASHHRRKFAYIGGPGANEEAQIRRAAFFQVLHELRLTVDPELVCDGLFTIQSGVEAANGFLASNKPFDALIAANDEMAIGALSVLEKNGIAVPDDVSLTGFDDIPNSRFTTPTLSTMRTPLEEMGRRAVELLHRQLQGEEVPLVSVVDPVLICRESCGCRYQQVILPGFSAGSSTQDAPAAPRDERSILEKDLREAIPIPDSIHPHWARQVVDAVFSALEGESARFVDVLRDILKSADHQLWVGEELQNLISRLRSRFHRREGYDHRALEDLWDSGRRMLFHVAANRQMEGATIVNTTNRLFLNRSAGELAGSLTREALVETITTELDTIGILNGVVSVFTNKEEEALECVAAFSDGKEVPSGQPPYPVATFIPPCLSRASRTSYVVLVLSSGDERLGVLALEFGVPEIYYEMCREHMSSYLKAIALYQQRIRQLQAETEETRRELEMQHRQKLESLGVLAGGIAHDFNNMLAAMLGNLDVALIDIEEGTPDSDPILECKSIVRHATGLCRQLLDYSGKGKFVVRRINLNQVLRDLESLLKMAVSTHVSLVLDLDGDLPDIEGDVTQINQVFVNLVINGAEAIENSGGTVTVRTGSRYCDREAFKGSVFGDTLPEGTYVTVSVTDTGKGIPEDALLQIFDPFYTTKVTGRGLGLAAVLGIVRGHRGAIKVSSQPGRGTCFEIMIPTLPRASDVPAKKSTPPKWRGKGTVLIVDDEPALLRAGRRLLERMGFSVVDAGDGQQAIDVFQDLEETVDCVIIDLTMPGMGGIDTMNEIRSLRADIPVILSSGYSEEQAIDMSGEGAPSAFLQKPYDAQALSRMLQQVLRADKESSEGTG